MTSRQLLRQLEEVFHHDGGILHVEQVIPPNVREYFEVPISVVQSMLNSFWTRQPNLQRNHKKPILCYIGSENPNAVSRSKGDQYFVGVNTGFVDHIAWWTNTLLSHPEIYPDLGRPNAECRLRSPSLKQPTDDRDANGWGVDDLDALLQNPFLPTGRSYHSNSLGVGRESMHYAHAGWHEPLDADRSVFARAISCAATCYAFLHEIGHVFGGHFEHRNNIPRGFLELDADMLMIQLSIGCRLDHELRSHFPQLDYLVDHCEQAADLPLYILGLGLLLSNLADFQNERTSEPQDTEHPHPRIRASAAVVALQHFDQRFEGYPVSDFLQSYVTALRTSFECWSAKKIQGCKMMPNADERAWISFFSEGISYVDVMSRCEEGMNALEKTTSRQNLGNLLSREMNSHGHT